VHTVHTKFTDLETKPISQGVRNSKVLFNVCVCVLSKERTVMVNQGTCEAVYPLCLLWYNPLEKSCLQTQPKRNSS